MTPIKAMLFDLDGTLVDSAPDLVAALNHVRAGIGLEPVSVAAAGHGVTRGAPGLLKVGMPKTDARTFESWRRQLIEHYAASGYARSRCYAGVDELLELLETRGIPWGIVTNKAERLTHAFIEAKGFTGRASSVVCGDTLPTSKPHPAPVLLACEQLGAEPPDTVFVGDDLRDIQAGAAAGTRTAAVYYGYGSGGLGGPLVENSFPVHHPSDLAQLLR